MKMIALVLALSILAAAPAISQKLMTPVAMCGETTTPPIAYSGKSLGNTASGFCEATRTDSPRTEPLYVALRNRPLGSLSDHYRYRMKLEEVTTEYQQTGRHPEKNVLMRSSREVQREIITWTLVVLLVFCTVMIIKEGTSGA